MFDCRHVWPLNAVPTVKITLGTSSAGVPAGNDAWIEAVSKPVLALRSLRTLRAMRWTETTVVRCVHGLNVLTTRRRARVLRS